MGHRTTRPHATLRACRIGRYAFALAVLAWLAGAPVLAQTGPAQVDRVIDGDTIRVRLDGARYTVRLTGVDTPETTHPTRGVEPDGPEAAAYTTARLTGATGQGVPKDPREAVIWYHQSADLGYAAGQYNLARAYYFGDGAPLDRSQAATWCRRAAQGHANAQFSLALMLDAGRGTGPRRRRPLVSPGRRAPPTGATHDRRAHRPAAARAVRSARALDRRRGADSSGPANAPPPPIARRTKPRAMPIRLSTAPRRFSAASLPPPTCSTATNRTARPPTAACTKPSRTSTAPPSGRTTASRPLSKPSNNATRRRSPSRPAYGRP